VSDQRQYVVLEQSTVGELVTAAFEEAGFELPEEVLSHLTGGVYAEVARVPSRNAAHALSQVGRRYDAGITPPLVAVSERMFRPRTLDVSYDAKVKVA
jgi:hypothetical protein